MARKYQPVWDKLKSEGACTIRVPAELAARVKKAVCKEKYNDTAYKVSFDIQNLPHPELDITYDKKKNIMVFKLIKPISLKDL